MNHLMDQFFEKQQKVSKRYEKSVIQLGRGNFHSLSQEYILEEDAEDLKSEPDLTESFLPKLSCKSKLTQIG